MTLVLNSENFSQSATSMSKINNSLTRNFAYKLTDKKATSNFLKAASKDPIEVDEKQKCTMLIFSVGAYSRAVFPLLHEWKSSKDEFQSGNLLIKQLNFAPGYDESGKNVDSVVSFNVNGRKVTVSCFNTTQKIKVEGPLYKEFVQQYLVQYFNQKMRPKK